MKGCLKGQRNGTAIIDLDQTVQGLRQGLKVMETIHQKKGNILFVAQNPDAQQIVQDLASRTNQFYMTKWVNGFLTNWSVQQEYMATFYQTLNEGTLSKGRQRRKIQQLRQNYAGVLDMHEKPSVIFLFHAWVGKRHSRGKPCQHSFGRCGGFGCRSIFGGLSHPRKR